MDTNLISSNCNVHHTCTIHCLARNACFTFCCLYLCKHFSSWWKQYKALVINWKNKIKEENSKSTSLLHKMSSLYVNKHSCIFIQINRCMDTQLTVQTKTKFTISLQGSAVKLKLTNFDRYQSIAENSRSRRHEVKYRLGISR